MSFQQGLSGLNAAAKSLDVIGNNVANASTVGFKESQAQFADVYASSLTGAGGNQAGIGVKVAQIAQEFTQGNISSSNNPLDLAINGGGFYRLTINGSVQYSRNGQFQLDKNGFIVNAQQAKVTGYQADTLGVLSTGAPVPIQINTSDLAPKVTTKVAAEVNLDSRNVNPTGGLFNPGVPTSYNSATSVNVYDTLGNAHVVQTFFVKTAPSNWDVYVTNDGVEVSKLKATEDFTKAFDAAGPAPNLNTVATALQTTATTDQTNAATALVTAQALPTGTPALDAIRNKAINDANTLAAIAASELAAANAAVTESTALGATVASVILAAANATPAARQANLSFTPLGALDGASVLAQPFTLKLPLQPPTGAVSPLSTELNFTNTTQFGSNFSTNKLTQDGYTAGRLSGFSTGSDGIILARYTNGQSNVLGQVVLANFANPNGLSPLGNNAWVETSTSGAPLVGVPNSGPLGVIQSSATEDANVDLTAELVKLITAQRVYQANAQTIKTQDSVLQTLVNLR
jgi:flagellar hook protein FlgE